MFTNFLLVVFFFMFMDLYKKYNRLLRQVDALDRSGSPSEVVEETVRAPEAVSSVSGPEAVHEETGPYREEEQALPAAPVAVLGRTETDIPAQEGGASALYETVRGFFTGGNPLVKVGGIVFFLGLVFLVKYAADRDMISIQLRLLAVAAAALAITGLGWRLREREGYYGLILQAVGIAAFYLVVFASAKVYGLITLPQAFFTMLVVVILSSLLAVAEDAMVLALFSATGGFLVPILTSDGTGSHIVLFSYYALLNTGIFLIAWYRSWRVLNLFGFFFTFVIAVAWGVLRYEPALFASTEPFLIFFFLLYLGVSILFTLRQPFRVRAFIDATLVFGLPLVAFALQASMVDVYAYGVFASAAAVGTLYLALSFWLLRSEKMRMLGEAFRAIGIVFYTAAVPYALDDDLTGALWALEASAIIWISLKYKKVYGVLFGVALEFAAMGLYVLSTFARPAETAFVNGIFAGDVVLIAAALFTSYRFWVHRDGGKATMTETFSYLFLGSALVLWLAAGVIEAGRTDFLAGNVLLIYAALSAALFAPAALRLGWGAAGTVLQYYLPLGLLFFGRLLPHYVDGHPFAGLGGVAAALFLAVHYGLLWRFEADWRLRPYLHAAGMLVAVLLLSRELQYAAAHFALPETWRICAFGALPLLTLFLVSREKAYCTGFLRRNADAYRLQGGVGLAAVAGIWELYALTGDGAVGVMPYLPLLNPLDALQALGWIVFAVWFRRSAPVLHDAGWPIWKMSGLFLLIFATVVLGRTVHAYTEVGYGVNALAASPLFQASLAILWSMMGIAAMLLGKRREARDVWLAGAGLLGAVVVKLFLVDLAGSGTVERIVSFISVGALLLLVGYFAPIPPARPKPAPEA